MESRLYHYIIFLAIAFVSALIVLNPVQSQFQSPATSYLFTVVLTITVGLVVYSTWKSRQQLVKLFPVSKTSWLYLAAIVLAGLSLRMFLVPHVYRILFDEDIYLQVAANMAASGRALFCSKWIDGYCVNGFIDKHPNSFPHSLAIIYLFIGPNANAGFVFTVILGSVSVALMFLLTYLLFADESTALYSALFLALTPAHIIWSGSISSEIFHTFLSLLAFIYALAYVKTHSTRILLGCAGLLSYGIQTRPESAFLAPLAFIILFSYSIRKINRKFIDDMILFSTVLIILNVLHFTHLNYASQTHDWGSATGKFSLGYIDWNWEPNTSYWFDGRRHLLVVTPLALLGLLAALKRKSASLPLLILWFGLFFTTYMFFYASAFTSGGIGFRYALICYPPLLILAAVGSSAVVDFLSKTIRRRDAVLFIVALSLVTFLPTIYFVSTPEPQADVPRELHDFAVEMADRVDDRCVIITHNPSIFVVEGQNNMQITMAMNRDVVRDLMRRHACVYFLEGYWCNSEPAKSHECRYMHDNYDLERIATRNAREKGWVFNFYKLKLIF
jgi:4-amino-4-deoxy-L-arabinose transferase-like glycosyltransferase